MARVVYHQRMPATPHNLAARIFGTPLLVAPEKLDAIVSVLGPRLGLDAPARAEGPEWEPKERAGASVSDGIAHVQAVGSLAHRVGGIEAISGLASYQSIGDEIDRALADPAVDGILLEVDSFGGEASGAFDLADKIRAAREIKPVYAAANQHALSAGYALLSQAERVYVPQTGAVGSIGVVSTHVDVSAAEAAAGVRVTHVHAGARKVDLSPHRALSDDARARLEEDVAQVYEQFLAAVAAGRGERLSAEAARETEADTYLGAEAVRAGLADDVGGVSDARAALSAEIKERKRMKEIETKLAAALAENAGMRAELAKLAAERTALLKAEDEGYLERLRAESAAAGKPIEADALARVEKLMGADREAARLLGDGLLEAARTAGGGKFVAAQTKPNKETGQAAMAAAGYARLLKGAGFEVTTDEHGAPTSIKPPSGGKRV